MRSSTVTLKEVALAAGVSKATAANALNEHARIPVHEATRRRVLDAAGRLGYRRNGLAAALSLGRTDTIGVILPYYLAAEGGRPDDQYSREVLLAVSQAAARAGLRITLPPFTEGQRPSVQEVADQRVDGLLLVSVRDPEFLSALHATGVPCVEVGSGVGECLVHPDNEGGAASAVEHLSALGHRRLVHFYGDLSGYASQRRHAGFEEAVRRLGAEGRAEAEPAYPLCLHGVGTLRAALSLPPSERPTAVFTFNDEIALGVLDLAREMGLRVPQDLSLVGFDDFALARAARPRLTTVRNPLAEQADRSIAALRGLISGRTPAELSLPAAVPTRLVVRESTAPAPGGA